MHRHRRSLLFLAFVLAIGGILGAFNLPVSLFPDVSFPRVRVTLDTGDQPADQMVAMVTRPVEEAIRQVRGVRELRSTTSRGSAEINIGFDWGADMGRALLDVDAAVGEALPHLPPGVDVQAIRLDPTVFPILAYSLRSDTLTPAQLHDIAEYQLRPLLSGVAGVAQVDVQGGEVAEFHVDVDAAKLRAQGLALTDVEHAVANAATIQSMGRLQDHYKLYLLLADNQPATIKALGDIVLRADAHGLLRLADVATVVMGHEPQWVRTTADGHDAVLMQVFQQPDGNSVQIANDVKQRLAEYQRQAPKGLHIANWYDQTQLVLGAAGSVRDAILIGIVLAALVLFVFLRNVRVILVALIVVPATLAVTVLLLTVLHMSFNMMTLGGMAAAVGLLIDDVIVMLEHIMRRLRDGGAGEVRERIAGAALEFTRPLTGSSAATAVIFLPLAFLSGVTGAFFKALSLTMASALVISYLLTWVAVPLLAEWLIDERHAAEHPPGRFSQRMLAGYERTLGRLLQRPALVLIGVIPLLLAGALAYRQVGSGFMPQMDEGGFTLDYLSPPGTSLDETDRLLQQVEKIIRANPYVDTYSRRTGLQLGGGLTEANTGDFFVRLKNGSRPATADVMEQIRQQVAARVPGLDVDVAQLMEDLIGDLTEVPQPIEIMLYGDDETQLDDTAKKVAAAIGKVDGIAEVHNGINPAGDALDVRVDPAKAGLLGLDPATVAQQVSDAMGGNVAAQLPQGPKMLGVRVWLPPASRAQVEQLATLPIRAGDGHVVPLSELATIRAVQGQPEINRDNLKRMIAVTARIVGRDLGSTANDVKQVLAKPGLLPPGMYHELGGLYAQQQTAFHDLRLVMLAAIALVFALLLFLYESFRVALAIMVAPLLALAAVFVGLWITGIELNISAMMGMTMIVGIVTELAIFYFTELREAEQDMSLHEALRHAGHHRMRPILMSTIAAILTLLPLALAIGEGSQMQQPLAVAIIAGMLVQVPLVLLVLPVVYSVLRKPSKSADHP
ncbi:efflux RND transporter permease subunit [Rhodanobacter sp. 7MK24]|uniref:efflux RND transporter permease subunit n=1 Tax=Rhodanobacter sp. 7MK24 TaxID=2775922 RepID=UPI00177C45B0|nr:efflux RND transporter permease subunit [Rhodanobacter sp. 7MK24]MBD8880635.1 efflux RND transporter permease subunit [Rhodanobacter sp. 7MK24]